MRDPTETLVADRLAAEQSRAEALAEEIARSKNTVSDRTISNFFPEISDLHGGTRSNVVRGVPLPHQLLFGPPLIFDLEPLSPRDFEARHRISVRAAEEFAEAGRLIPNLYVRNPERWAGMRHLEGLLSYSFANGVRVDAYFRLRYPAFANQVSARAAQLETHLHELEASNPEALPSLLSDARSEREDFARVIGTRWAYLDALAPQSSAHVEDLVAHSRLAEALEFIRLTKHAVVSPISAAIGGEFTWSKQDISRVQQIDARHPAAFNVPEYFERPEDVEFLIHHVTRIPPFQCLKDYHAEILTRLLASADLSALAEQLHTAMEAMAALAQRGEVSEAHVADWEHLAAEIRTLLDRYQWVGRKGASVGVALTVGFFIEPWLGPGAGALAEAIAGDYADRVGRSCFRLINPEKHRFLQVLDDFRSLSSSE